MRRTALLGAVALGLAPTAALSDGAVGHCIDVAVPKGAIAERNGRWIAPTPEQWQFLRGIYTMSPATPAGLPYGDAAALATEPDHHGGWVFFIDGGRACTPTPVPHELIDMLRDVATGAISHQGSDN
jgi:hypothetical protein